MYYFNKTCVGTLVMYKVRHSVRLSDFLFEMLTRLKTTFSNHLDFLLLPFLLLVGRPNLYVVLMCILYRHMHKHAIYSFINTP